VLRFLRFSEAPEIFPLRSPWREAMILEVAILDVKPGQERRFEVDFKIAEQFISAIEGYISHEIQRCIEIENRYLLLVKWQKLEDHTINFRGSPHYQEWKNLLHHYYDPFPEVLHFESL
jgi:heme-degrading monooxygenase HmoA